MNVNRTLPLQRGRAELPVHVVCTLLLRSEKHLKTETTMLYICASFYSLIFNILFLYINHSLWLSTLNKINH